MRSLGRSLAVVTVAAAAGLVLAACGGSSSAASSAASSGPAGQASATAEQSAPAEDSGGGVPDPCTLLSVADDITPILGKDPGVAVPNSVVPDVRKVCLFDSGLILAVEVGENYDQSIENVLDEATGATTTEISGVGERAVFSDYGGGITQVVALGGDYFVGVTGALTQEQATALAQAMLAAL